MKAFWTKHKKKLIIGAVALILILLIAGGKKDDQTSTFTVERGDIVDMLVLNGEAQPVQGADMAFSESGTVARIYKKAGDTVVAGEKIVELDNATLYAELQDAQATLDLARAEAKVSDAETDTDVASARAKLLSEGLEAYSRDTDNDNEPPTVSGSYRGTDEGQYRIEIESSGGASRLKIRYTGLETGFAEINFYKPIALGTKGLYLSFTKEDTSLTDVWLIDIPNVESEFYVENLNAYEKALASRDAADQGNISREISIARIKQAEAGVARIMARLNERTIRAPFAGTVSRLDIKIGEQAEIGTVVTGVIASGGYEVSVEVPESDIVNLIPGLPASITLDAYGEIIFPGTLASIDPGETEVDGVSMYRAKVLFSQEDERIRSGMTAAVSIEKSKVINTLRVPQRFITTDDSGSSVTILRDDEETNVPVVVGLKGSDGMVEVVTGVSEGDTLVGRFVE